MIAGRKIGFEGVDCFHVHEKHLRLGTGARAATSSGNVLVHRSANRQRCCIEFIPDGNNLYNICIPGVFPYRQGSEADTHEAIP
jgi:hypothetical protein